jgi:hypothetical protein
LSNGMAVIFGWNPNREKGRHFFSPCQKGDLVDS